MRRLTALLTTLMLPNAQPLLLGAVASTAVVVSQVPAQAQSTEAVAQIAQAITVRIEGATQGSGVLVNREGNRYTVLTAWHVVSGQRAGEELDVYTPDGQRHSVETSSITRIDQSDTALLDFVSPITYAIPAPAKHLAAAELIYIAGYPLNSSATLKIATAQIVGNTECDSQVKDGGLLYKTVDIGDAELRNQGLPLHYESSYKVILMPESDTRSGFSGGPILARDGSLIGHHNGGVAGANDWGVAVKWGLNRGTVSRLARLVIEGYVNTRAVCNIFKAYSASLEGVHSDAADYSLRAYRDDPRSLPFVSHALNFSLLKAGRFNELCELHDRGVKLNNISLNYLCSVGVPGVYVPK